MTQAGQVRRLKYGGMTFSVPDDWGDQEINAALNNYRQTPQFDASIDKRTGAPSDVRLKVNLAKKEEDRLSELRKHFPDAVPYGDGNFVYTDPKRKRLVLFDETKGGLFGSGFTLKDTYDIVREGAQAVGGTVGAVVGGVGGAVAGTAIADVGVDFLASTVLGVDDTRSLGEMAVDTATASAMAGGGELIGRYALPYASKAIKGVLGADQKSQKIFQALTGYDITPTAGAVTRGRGAGSIESALDAAPTATTRMKNQIEKVVKETEAAVTKMASKVGKARSQQETGIKVQAAVGAAQKRYHAQVAKLEGELDQVIGPDTMFGIDNLKQLRREWVAKISDSPNVFGPKYKGALAQIDGIIADAQANNGVIPYRMFREFRTDFRVVSEAFETDALQRPLYSDLYRAMTSDLKDGVDRIGGAALRKKWDETMKFQAQWKATNQDLFDKIAKYDAPEKVYRFLMNERTDGGTVLTRLKNEFTPEEWSDVSATVLQKLGYKRIGNELDTEFSINTFVTNYGNISNEAKDAFFGAKGSELRTGLDELFGLMKDMSESARLKNFSNTARATFALDTLSALGIDVSNIGVAGLTGQPGGIAAGAARMAGNVAGRLLFPNQIAKLMTSPRFVKWLASPVNSTSEIGGKIGQLLAIAAEEQYIAEEVYDFIEALGPQEGVRQ